MFLLSLVGAGFAQVADAVSPGDTNIVQQDTGGGQ
jgi:hypothetical protein